MPSHTSTPSFQALEAAADASEILSDGETRACLSRLQGQIARSDYGDKIRQLFCDIVNNTGKISLALFPTSLVLRIDVKTKVKVIVTSMQGDVNDIIGHIQENISAADTIHEEIQSIRGNRSEPATAQLMELISGIAIPTGSEARLFCDMTELFDITVYHPLLKLHEEQPDHDIWQLEDSMTTLRLEMNDMVRSARTADAAAAAVIKAFRSATTRYDREMMFYGIDPWRGSLPSEETLVNVDSECSFTSLEQIDEEPAEHEDAAPHRSSQMATRARPQPIVGPSVSLSPEHRREDAKDENVEVMRQRLITAFDSRLGRDIQSSPISYTLQSDTLQRSRTHSPSKSMPTTTNAPMAAVRHREYTL